MKKIIIFTTIIFVFFSMQCFGEDYIKGKIVSNLEKKLKIVYGDKAIITLGSNHGLVKGDILSIARPADVYLADPVGQCAIQKTFPSTSICEVIKMTQEIEGGQQVFMKRLEFNDPKLFPDIFRVLQNLVEPYAPYKDISVYIFNVFDENRNITKFSELLKDEIKFVFSQKKRIKFVGDDVGKMFAAYSPNELFEKNNVIEGYMKKDNIDALITGYYEVRGGKVFVTLYKIDSNWDVAKRQDSIDGASYGNLLTTVTVPYTPLKKEQNVTCNFVYKPVRHKPLKKEKDEYIANTAQNDPLMLDTLQRVDFNMVGPVEFKLKVDNDMLDLENKKEYKMLLRTGKHEITTSFKTGFYYNETLMFTSPNECKGCRKSVVLQLDKDDEINVEITADPLYGREKIDFNVYTKVITSRPVLKPISRKEKVVPVETYKD
ncbi:MAG: hypothetical protein A4E64_00132 [Syntrophorhabdus sp. PtaU1.Bin058]|nr:MAG: hypothetical protein A4E64_00132 [Syntrophorhabdus sp. PtaU1.Bin058]